jgi:hypothetical protein
MRRLLIAALALLALAGPAAAQFDGGPGSRPHAGQGVFNRISPGAWDKAGVFLNTAANTTTAGWQKVPLDTVFFDTAGLWDSVNKRIKPRKAGYYLVSGRARTNTAGALATAVGLNGAQYQGIGVDPGANTVLADGATSLIYCNGTSDYIELYVFTTVARAYTVSGFDTWLNVVGPF